MRTVSVDANLRVRSDWTVATISFSSFKDKVASSPPLPRLQTLSPSKVSHDQFYTTQTRSLARFPPSSHSTPYESQKVLQHKSSSGFLQLQHQRLVTQNQQDRRERR
ncbi:hypothetical protein F2P81_024789 [Scophthalmus maximus]|uniref:Uncharacterized protein n=1 Tax=Scophthalmus maximus TaxID=52904 RepID=A0A6A4RRZ2_SCOMX|nr:hypothetical protein F2P81_024789 [Scophthalmus maximus]